MGDLTDFEELIALHKYFLSDSQKSSQEPLNDVLDRMCEIIDDSNLTMEYDINMNETSDNPNVNTTYVNELESISVLKDIGKDTVDIVNKDKINDYSNNNANEQKYNDEVSTSNILEEFESILAAKAMGNEIVTKDESIDMEEFKDILGDNSCFGDGVISDESEINDIDRNDESINKIGQVVANDDLDEFQVILATEYLKDSNLEGKVDKTEDDNITINDEVIAKDENDEEIIDLDDFISEKLYYVEDNVAENCESNATSIHRIESYEVPIELEVESNRLEATEKCADGINISSDSEDGYNSSDFEFITEEDASKAGLITKFNKITINENKTAVRIPNTGKFESRKNEASPSDYIKYSKYKYRRCYAQRSTENHTIPEGERYLYMFRGEYAPVVLNNLHGMGNKKCIPSGLMTPGTEDPGVDLLFRAPEEEEHYKQYKDDADECLKKILATYPQENKKKKRRLRNVDLDNY
ncbi:reticulocyte-binding protein 1-like [Leguminivora glycinivorella]|uniref:reticulocyte-binding protein 1-like n=1 Tax=Leguminivora glycinivorella TaxID=1035111 RepID=UPI00200CB1D9|nr:reticulocyte-binding protein 1-like [Leguminivora glycinivorella]